MSSTGTVMADHDHTSSETLTVNQLSAFLAGFTTSLFGGDSIQTYLSHSTEAHELLGRYIGSIQETAIFLTRSENEDGVEYKLFDILTFKLNNASSTIIIIKRRGQLLGHIPLSAQLLITTISPASDADPNETYNSIKLILNYGIQSYFESTTPSQTQSQVMNNTKKKFNELSLSLTHLQQTIQIPNLTSTTHERIIEQMEKETTGRFLNELQSIVNDWIKQVYQISKLNHDPADGDSTLEEIQFWNSKEQALLAIKEQLSTPEVTLTLEILRSAKRYHTTVSFLSDTGIDDSLQLCHCYNSLLKDLPVSELVAASTLNEVKEAMELIFSHLKKLRVGTYPIVRSINLVEVIISDIIVKLSEIIREFDLMNLDYSSFAINTIEIKTVFELLEDKVKEYTSLARELLRKRSEKFMIVKVNYSDELRERLIHLEQQRNKHEEFSATILTLTRTFNSPNFDFMKEINYAYESLTIADSMDFSNDGKKHWNLAEIKYRERLMVVESAVIQLVKRALDSSKTSTEMFSIFEKLEFLLGRPNIRAAVQEYQIELVTIIQRDLDSLQSQFQAQSKLQKLIQFRGLPPFTSTIVWVNQMRYKLDFLVTRLVLVLTKDWFRYPEGKRIYNEISLFKERLNLNEFFQRWLTDVKLKLDDPIFKHSILKISSRSLKSDYKLLVNFDLVTVNLFREVNNLSLYGFDIPRNVLSYSQSIESFYHYAINLSESVINFEEVTSSIDKLGELKSLVVPLLPPILAGLSLLTKSQWGDLSNAQDLIDSKLEHLDEVQVLKIVMGFESQVVELIDKYEQLLLVQEKLIFLLEELETCPYSFDNFKKIMLGIQKLIDNLILDGFTKVDDFVDLISVTTQRILTRRCVLYLQAWADQFEQFISKDENHIHERTHRIVIQNLKVTVLPQLESSKTEWISQLNDCVHCVSYQSILTTENFDVEMPDSHTKALTYRQIEDSVINAYQLCIVAIDSVFGQAKKYLNTWLQSQSLWDLDVDEVTTTIGRDLQKWLSILKDMKRSREILDTIETSKRFGPLVLDYEQVQSRVNVQYDYWQKQMTIGFANVIGTKMNTARDSLTQSRKQLESVPVNFSSSESTIRLISAVHNVKELVTLYPDTIVLFESGQRVLIRSRFRFPPDWVYFEQIKSDFSSLTELLEKRTNVISSQSELVSSIIDSEISRLHHSIADIKKKWTDDKPIGRNLSSVTALKLLTSFESGVMKLLHDGGELKKAGSLMNLPVMLDTSIQEILDEIIDLKSVWTSIGALSRNLSDITQESWHDVSIRSIRKKLDDLLAKSRSMPAKVRQYSAFEELQSSIKNFIKVTPILNSLKSDCVAKRHWSAIFKQLTLKDYPAELTLKCVLNLDLVANDKYIKSVIQRAQGEKDLSDSINTIEETWSNLTFELFQYNDKCRLIRGWDVLFQKTTDDLNSLSSMKLSPYYELFEKRANVMSESLNSVYSILDSWIDVQRQWIYLSGVFDMNEDIKNLLPVESTRFFNTSREFFSLMKQAFKSMLVVDIISIPALPSTLEKTHDTLEKIRKSLLGYLEKQREAWPRFYFLGNEDLLEIIGNSHNMALISKHLVKMFSGISNVVYDAESMTIRGVTSPEGETVNLDNSISLIKNPSPNDWLNELDSQVKDTLAKSLSESVLEFTDYWRNNQKSSQLFDWVNRYPNQVLILTLQIVWTDYVEKFLASETRNLKTLLESYVSVLKLISSAVLGDLSTLLRRKLENLIIELLHQRDVLSDLIADGITSKKSYKWISQQRYYYNKSAVEISKCLIVKQANSSFYYGFEYLGVPARLVYTPLVNTCFIGMTEALNERLGGSLIGPAGTGKTESIKALAQNLGMMVLVFCCDETFDLHAVSRILVGICGVGAWCCFDEFNRLDEKSLSAVSTQVEKIEAALTSRQLTTIDLLGKRVSVHPDSGIFITSNPNYAGRSVLPDNLKSKYRTVAVVKPDTKIIADAIFTSQGFTFARELSSQVVDLFISLQLSCSKQPHYDFGLRALKSTLVNCGSTRRVIKELGGSYDTLQLESQIVVESLNNVVLPKLIPQDESVFEECMKLFGSQSGPTNTLDELMNSLLEVANSQGISATENWKRKAQQLYEIQKSHHGFMLVGQASTGKSTLFNSLIESIHKVTGVENVTYKIDPKALGKDALFGTLDYATRDWTDGVFTSILRKVNASLRGEKSKNIWIVFDGDVDPNWVENLNSVLDDNKILTLPNGERIDLPENLKIVFEVEDLVHATLATVSRCGIVWFSDLLFDMPGLYSRKIWEFENSRMENEETVNRLLFSTNTTTQEIRLKVAKQIQEILPADVIQELYLVSMSFSHIMRYDYHALLSTLFSLLRVRFDTLISYIQQNIVFVYEDLSRFIGKHMLASLIWALAGDCSLEERDVLSKKLLSYPCFDRFIGDACGSFHLFDVTLPECLWESYSLKVPSTTIEPHMITQPDIVIPTTDTVIHEDLIFTLLSARRPLILCGPPGSGKTMTLMAALRKSPDFLFVGVNFSKDTTPEFLLKTLEQHCIYKKRANGVTLAPSISDKWMVVFCDEVNLPALDEYGSQNVISFIRQLIELGGFWNKAKGHWVTLTNIQFVAACNPPTDPGRNSLSPRFLRHCSVIKVNYPGRESLEQIYGTFNTSILKCIPDLRGYSGVLTSTMIQIYECSAAKFKLQDMATYIYSPRELTRWVRGIYEAIQPLNALKVEGLIRLCAHEALRLFSDRLANEADREWTFQMIKNIISSNFSHLDLADALRQPILFSDWLSYEYSPVDEKELTSFVDERLAVFSEEETSVSLVLYRDLLDHVLRIDRVLRNPQGHLILVGPSSSGKTVISKFVAWINGLKVFQLNVSRKYSLAEFDKTLRMLLCRCGAEGEKICFIIDEATILETAFLERMNTLLANAEIPGLFEGEEFQSLMSLCSQYSQQLGLYLDSDEELYQWFTKQVSKNFHVIFTISDPNHKGATQIISSPALFNRCVVNWMGDWSETSLKAITSKMLEKIPIDNSDYEVAVEPSEIISYRELIVESLVSIHCERRNMTITENISPSTPGDFLAFINNFSNIFLQNEDRLQQYQAHINNGLDKLRETFLSVKELNESLTIKRAQLNAKDEEARKMLDRMITDQNEAERKQEASIEIHKLLESQENRINERRNVVLADLAEVEPLILEAQRGVKDIKKQHLTEMRSMQNPPEAVKMTLESVCILLGYNVKSWRDVQMIIRRDDFIANIVSYDSEIHLTKEIADFMEEEYLSRPNYNYEAVNRASKACGPLVLWAQAQLRYAAIVERIDPLRQEVEMLQNELINTKSKLIAIDGMITDLQDNIESYKLNYSESIREKMLIKSEMADVEAKVTRSTHLLESLKGERLRWGDSVGAFKKQRENLVGDTILSAAFMTYVGPFDQMIRSELEKTWKSRLASMNISYTKGLRMIDNISNSSQLLQWEQNGLPNDDLFLENTAIMYSAADRISYIIDPPGLTTNFLVKQLLPKQLIVTSFLDDSFIKQLENCIRFGGSILIQDAEYFDPVISRVIGRDIEVAGGRNLVRLGNKQIDLSPNFKLYLHTKDPSVRVPTFISSRMTVLNFTFTTSSLVKQALNLCLKIKKPDVEKERLELLKVNGEYKEALRGLEKDLLSSLNDTKVEILDNDDMVHKLELIKSESEVISAKAAESTVVIEQVDAIMNTYLPLANRYAKLHVLLSHLHKLNPIYHFSNTYLEGILLGVLKRSTGNVDDILVNLVEQVHVSTAISLTQKDRPVFGLVLFLISSTDGEAETNDVISSLLRSLDGDSELNNLLDQNSALGSLLSHYGELQGRNLKQPVKLQGYEEIAQEHDLLLMRSSAGFDSRFQIENLAKSSNKEIISYSMGSSEGLEVSKRLVLESTKNGNWLVIENIQMSPELLDFIPRLVENTTKHPEFKLFLTCQLDSKISIITSKIFKSIIFENNPGVKLIMNDHLLNPSSTLNVMQLAEPIELKKLYFLLTWFYALLKELVRFSPFSFKKQYEFGENDLLSSKIIIDHIVSDLGKNKTNISPDFLPWDCISNLVGRIAFGGKIDDPEDLEKIMDIATKFFSLHAFDYGFNLLLTNAFELKAPESYKAEEYVTWVNDLPEIEPVQWLGLDSKADEQMNRKESEMVVKKAVQLFEEIMINF
ncbi:hypothetical protein CANARDRAFT_211710 [[Candida] arabinofermentans NRRL YB-2248]|uniref:Dynein heavy chain, cytoplasmic n=1 Tax=[Candida] arabinofermentans NRRL YB-2248 TaxID=983967 RepID=A0A1E4T3H0_9ASCO|nr:hypothetical protein CANARDRAFT_211710 [[Candida] arabinofermentans NRRL YB-2248]